MQQFHIPFYVPLHPEDRPKIEIVNIITDPYIVKPESLTKYYRKLSNIEEVQQYVNEVREKQINAEKEAKSLKRDLRNMNMALKNFIAHIQYMYCPGKNDEECIEIQNNFHNTFDQILKQYEELNYDY